MARLGIIGAGRFALLIAELAQQVGGYKSILMYDDTLKYDRSRAAGGLDDVDAAISTGSIDQLAIGIGYRHFSLRQALYDKYCGKIPFATLIHPSAAISPTAVIEPGCLIFSMVNVEAHVHLEPNITIFNQTSVTHEVGIGAHSFLSVGVAMGGGVKIGRRVFIGVNATIVNDITIGDDCVICAGTFLSDSIANGEAVIGNPFKRISRPDLA